MSYADYRFVANCRKILKEGISDKGTDVRPKWADGTPAYTNKILYVHDEYQLAKDSIPVMTLRKSGFKNAIDEILWIYQRKTSKLSELHSHIWDQWNVGNGTIGKAYGYQIAQRSKHHKLVTDIDLSDVNTEWMAFGDGRNLLLKVNRERYEKFPSAGLRKELGVFWVYMDQMDAVLYDLTYNWTSRSILTNTYNHADLAEMGLRPCAYSMSYNVTVENGEKILNGCLFQRSQDTLTANNWNVIQYSVLLQMVAQVTGMKPGKFVHNIADMHIYDRHMPFVQEMIDTYNKMAYDYVESSYNADRNTVSQALEDSMYGIPHPNPKFWINPEVTNFYDFTVDDFKLIDYEYEPFDHKIEVAI